ncbi:MAG: hypothetical protein V1870_05560 [Candidatus Aenigmatarchaeota archaeon]
MNNKKIKEMWKFIENQFIACQRRMHEKSYREAVDLIYDIAGNISNLYWLIEYGQISTDKGKVLNNISSLFKDSKLSKDYSVELKENWELRNIAKYGYFASSKTVINSIEIPESTTQELFTLIKDMFNECKKHIEKVVT